LLRDAAALKKETTSKQLAGRSLALLFEKPSLRTRVSFEVAMFHLGGNCLYLSPAEVGLGKRERVSDVAHVLGRYVQCIAARTYSHETVRLLAAHAGIPVINALSDEEHPCQAFADMLTIMEKFGKLAGISLAYVGDGNNVANSLMLAAAMSGIDFRIASPRGYEVQKDVLHTAMRYAEENKGKITTTNDPLAAVAGARVVYTDVWVSMGQEKETQERLKVFAPYRIDQALMARAMSDAIFMHPLPAHMGEEVSTDVLDSKQSVVFDQAENRLHIQKALLQGVLS